MLKLEKIIVNRPSDSSIFISKNGTYDVTGKKTANVAVPNSGSGGNSGGADIQLFAPTIEISGNDLIISDANGDFAEQYAIYSNGALLCKTVEKTIDLAEYIKIEGTYEIKVKAIGNVMTNSEYSNVIPFTYQYGTAGLAYTLSDDGTYYSCSGIGTAVDTDIVVASVYNKRPVKKLLSSAFKSCSNITSITLQAPMNEIGSQAFNGCRALRTVTLPSSIKRITNAFINTSVNTVYYMGDLESWCNIDFDTGSSSVSNSNPAYNAKYVYFNGELIKDVIIPETVTRIGALTFCMYNVLNSVTIHNKVTSIGSYAFYMAKQLKSVTFEKGSQLTFIGERAFSSCGLESIEIPENVTSISNLAFFNCDSLVNVKMLSVTPPTLSNSVFLDIYTDFKIYVPAESVEAYKAATNWSAYADKITAITE